MTIMASILAGIGVLKQTLGVYFQVGALNIISILELHQSNDVANHTDVCAKQNVVNVQLGIIPLVAFMLNASHVKVDFIVEMKAVALHVPQVNMVTCPYRHPKVPAQNVKLVHIN